MKTFYVFKLISVAALIAALPFYLGAQDTLVQWTFPTESGFADAAAIADNLDQEIETAGGTSAIQFKNGATTKAAQATAWQDGANEKKWKVEFATTSYSNLKLSSKISSGGQNPGPRDFMVQFKVGDESWTDLDNSYFQTANDWNTGVLENLPLPVACNNQQLIKLRWILTSDTATDGSILTETGISKIDDIFITGDIIDATEELTQTKMAIYPNPAIDFMILEHQSSVEINIYDMSGSSMLQMQSNNTEIIDLSALKPGVYIFRLRDIKNGSINSQRILIQ